MQEIGHWINGKATAGTTVNVVEATADRTGLASIKPLLGKEGALVAFAEASGSAWQPRVVMRKVG